jgi:ubiquinone biosynthesis protein UbiJ
MPRTPTLARHEDERRAQPFRLAGEREQLIGLVNACQQCLGELLHALHAARVRGRDPEGPAQSDLMSDDGARAMRVVAETLARLDELAPREPVVAARPEELEAVRATTEQLSARLARLDGAIEERMLRTSDLAARGAEIAMQERLKALRADIECIRRSVADATTDLRGALARQDAARETDVGGLRTAIDALRADLVRLDVSVDGRILAKVEAAWRRVDVELAHLRGRVEAMLAASAGGAWSALGRLVRDPLGAVVTVAGFVLGRLFR